MKFIKKKRGKFLIKFILLFIICMCFTGCSLADFFIDGASNEPYESEEARLYNKAVDEFFAALDDGDASAISAMFAERVRNEDTDLDEQIKKLIGLYPGPTEVNKRDGSVVDGSYSDEYGEHISTVGSTFPVVSNGVYYWCDFEYTYENDGDKNEIGIQRVVFFTADERCIYRYGEGYEYHDEPGMTVCCDRTLDCEVRAVEGEAYEYAPGDTPLNPEGVKAFLESSNDYSEFVERFGVPNAVNIYYIYELPDENGQPRYLRLTVLEDSDEIHSANVVDDFKWQYTLWEAES